MLRAIEWCSTFLYHELSQFIDKIWYSLTNFRKIIFIFPSLSIFMDHLNFFRLGLGLLDSFCRQWNLSKDINSANSKNSPIKYAVVFIFSESFCHILSSSIFKGQREFVRFLQMGYWTDPGDQKVWTFAKNSVAKVRNFQ